MGRQKELEGFERKKITEVNNAADEYVKQRNARMRLSKKEKEAKDALIAVMRKHKQTVYRDDEASPPVLVTLSSKDNVKVTEVDSDPEADDDAGDDEEKGEK